MSVTSILNYNNPRFREYRSTLAKYQIPKFKLEGFEIKAKPQSQNYSLIGTAFDYLLRFTIERNFRKYVITRKWVAENAVESLSTSSSIIYGNPNILDDDFFNKRKEITNEIKSRFDFVKEVFYYNYINNYKSIDVDLMKSCLFLAKLDPIFRVGSLGVNEIDFFYESDEDIADMKSLIEICDINIFKPKRKIILNPVFGNASSLVGGADADIIIDDILIDIKVTKQLKVTRFHYNQIISYYLLHLIEKIEKRTDLVINKLGIYSARYGCLISIPISFVGTNESFLTAINILKKNLNNR